MRSLPPSSNVRVYTGIDLADFDSWLYYIERVWLRAVFKDQMTALPSVNLLMWERARANYPTEQEWLARNPSPGQIYQPFSLPRPEQ